jgi:glucans biosynthesis protein
MSGSEPYRLIAPLALLLLPALGCGTSEQGSTLPSDGQEANPTERAGLAQEAPRPGTPPGPAREAVTPATLAAHVESKARALAHHDYSPPATSLPADLAKLDYGQYQSIRFRPEAALWRGETPFEVQLLHQGSLYRAPVRIHMVDDERVFEIPFDAGLFDYDGAPTHVTGADAADLGYSGFRIHYALNDPGVADEVAVFQGASYFRLLGPGHVHGLSSRGLAIGIGDPAGEEFPDFTEFWLVRPESGETTLVFHALLDSPSVTGAYRFELEPGARTELRVDARLFARRDVVKLGVAPLSTMFLYGPNRAGDFDDFRPEVHDSDGLMMLTRAGEWIWRPLANRLHVRGTALEDRDLRGFGLAQREREFARYLDVEALYHRRPSEWVLVEDDWGTGVVELLEAPTDSEFSDNIATAWVPEAPFSAGDERRYRYRLITFDGRLEAQTLAQVVRTGTGWDALPGEASQAPRSQRRFIIDFAHGTLDAVDRDARVEALIHTTSGEISDLRTTRLPTGHGWRVSFRLAPDGARPADMRLYLVLDGTRSSETWSYVWYPDEVPGKR